MVRVRSFFAVGFGLSALVACGRFGILEDEDQFGGGPPSGVVDGGSSGGLSPDGAAPKPPQPSEPEPPEGCEPGQTPHANAACIAEAAGLFVDAAAPADGDGTIARPMQRIQDAIVALDTLNDGRRAVFIAAGSYPENVSFRERAFKLYGGLVPAAGGWTVGPHKSVVNPATGYALEVRGGAQQSRFEDLLLEAAAPPGGSRSTIAILVVDSGVAERLVFERVDAVVARGLAAPPTAPSVGDSCGRNGKGGGPLYSGDSDDCTCFGVSVRGGEGGFPLLRQAMAGANNAPGEGAPGENACVATRAGVNGTDRSSAAAPAGGASAADEGAVDQDSWVERSGLPGTPGVGGGGGGGGGRATYGNVAHGGGSGGSGGCGGAGGAGGAGGGSSIGVLAIRSPVRFATATISTGSGGDGAPGGAPGTPGAGGQGGEVLGGCDGGRGGNGGAGGPGSAGGGGAGGASVAVVADQPVEGIESLEHIINGTGGGWGGEPRRGRPVKLLQLNPDGRLVSP